MDITIYNETVQRLARTGVNDPTRQIIALAEEINRYRDRIFALEDAARMGSGDVWAPASELPPDGETVLVWFEYFRYGEYNRMFQTYGLGQASGGEWSRFVNNESGWHKLKILAWAPLPPEFRAVPERIEWDESGPDWNCPVCGYSCDDPHHLDKFCPGCGVRIHFATEEG